MKQQDICDLMAKEGFKHLGLTGGNHIKWGDGKIEVVTSNTPSDHRVLHKIRCEIKRKRRALNS